MTLRNMVVLGLVMIVTFACCSSQMSFTKAELQKNQTVKLFLRSGESVKGEIVTLNKQKIVVRDSQGKNWRAKVADVVNITGPDPVYDFENNVISEREISDKKTSSSTLMYAVAGGMLSLGGSFFIGSMISRAAEDGTGDGIVYGVTGVGTAIGTFLFAKKGAKKDRMRAINQIADARSGGKGSNLKSEQDRHQQIQDELTRLKKQRAQQEAEIKSLKEKIKAKGVE